MRRLVWVRTAPPDVPGSMAAYGELVRRAVEPLATGWEFASCDLFDPRGGDSMWRHHLWRLRNVRRALAEQPADLYHWLDGSMAAFIPPALRAQSVATVHDLIPLLQGLSELPGKPSWPAAWLIRRGVRALRACAALCADSAATQADLARLAGIADRVAVVPVPLRPLPPPRPTAVAGLPPGARFILHVGHGRFFAADACNGTASALGCLFTLETKHVAHKIYLHYYRSSGNMTVNNILNCSVPKTT